MKVEIVKKILKEKIKNLKKEVQKYPNYQDLKII